MGMQKFSLGGVRVRNDKTVKWLATGVGVLFLVYVGFIVWFDARLGYNQPQGSTSLVIATFNGDNERHERVLRHEKIDGRNYSLPTIGRVCGTTRRLIIRMYKYSCRVKIIWHYH